MDFMAQVMQDPPGLAHAGSRHYNVRRLIPVQGHGLFHRTDKMDLIELKWILAALQKRFVSLVSSYDSETIVAVAT